MNIQEIKILIIYPELSKNGWTSFYKIKGFYEKEYDNEYLKCLIENDTDAFQKLLLFYLNKGCNLLFKNLVCLHPKLSKEFLDVLLEHILRKSNFSAYSYLIEHYLEDIKDFLYSYERVKKIRNESGDECSYASVFWRTYIQAFCFHYKLYCVNINFLHKLYNYLCKIESYDYYQSLGRRILDYSIRMHDIGHTNDLDYEGLCKIFDIKEANHEN